MSEFDIEKEMQRMWKRGGKFSDRVRKSFNSQTLNKLNMSSELEMEKKLKHFQLALSMVGISANLMTVELIKELASAIDEKGDAFSVKDANDLAGRIHAKYQPLPPAMPPGMAAMSGENLPPELKKMMDDGKIIMGKKEELPIEPSMDAAQNDNPTLGNP